MTFAQWCCFIVGHSWTFADKKKLTCQRCGKVLHDAWQDDEEEEWEVRHGAL